MKELSNNKVMVFGDSVSKGVVYDGRELSVLDNGVVKEVTDHYRVEFKNISVYGQTLKRLYDRRIIDKHLKEMSDEDAALTYGNRRQRLRFRLGCRGARAVRQAYSQNVARRV